MVELRTISPERYAVWHTQIWELYKDELIQSGMPEDKAKYEATEGYNHSMPNGILAKDNYVFDVIHEGEAVGIVWLVNQNNEWYIYDIDITEALRGQGLGRQTMKAIEAYVSEQNGNAINLSVFGFNTVAKNLYDSEGYETTRYQMKKKLI